jgi:hypothetical protein
VLEPVKQAQEKRAREPAVISKRGWGRFRVCPALLSVWVIRGTTGGVGGVNELLFNICLVAPWSVVHFHRPEETRDAADAAHEECTNDATRNYRGTHLTRARGRAGVRRLINDGAVAGGNVGDVGNGDVDGDVAGVMNGDVGNGGADCGRTSASVGTDGGRPSVGTDCGRASVGTDGGRPSGDVA